MSCMNSPFRYISMRSSTAPLCSFIWADVTCFSAAVTTITHSLVKDKVTGFGGVQTSNNKSNFLSSPGWCFESQHRFATNCIFNVCCIMQDKTSVRLEHFLYFSSYLYTSSCAAQYNKHTHLHCVAAWWPQNTSSWRSGRPGQSGLVRCPSYGWDLMRWDCKTHNNSHSKFKYFVGKYQKVNNWLMPKQRLFRAQLYCVWPKKP